MVDIFFYLLENYPGIAQCPDAITLARRMAYEGFEEHEVHAAVTWVEQLREPLAIECFAATHAHSTRVFHNLEWLHIGHENLNLLSSLEYAHSITAQQREHIIERCMVLPFGMINTETFKALVLTILWADNQTIDDALLHALMDDFGSAISHWTAHFAASLLKYSASPQIKNQYRQNVSPDDERGALKWI